MGSDAGNQAGNGNAGNTQDQTRNNDTDNTGSQDGPKNSFGIVGIILVALAGVLVGVGGALLIRRKG